MDKTALAARLRDLNEHHKQYVELFLRFALVAGNLGHELRELGITEVRTHGHIRFAFLSHEIQIDYRPCIWEGRLVGKMRFTQKELADEAPPHAFFALYFDTERRVGTSPDFQGPTWNLLDEAQAWEFLGAALMEFASARQLPA